MIGSRNLRNYPTHDFLTPPNILHHIYISLTARLNCLQFGMHRVYKHMVFVTKFGINSLY